MTASKMTVAITGHRPKRLPRQGADRIRASIWELVFRFPQATWLAGGAIGTDQIATDELLALGQRVELVLPFRPEVQAELWSESQRQVLFQQIANAAAVEVLREAYHPDGYRERNNRLVERADLVVAYWDGTPSGTAATVYEAVRQKVPVHWVPMI